MALEVHNITGDAWTPITDAGLSGTCWLQEIPGKGQVVINHSETLIEFEIDESYFLLNAKRRLQLIGAESGDDIYYARCSVPGTDAVVITDTGHGFVGDPLSKIKLEPNRSVPVTLQDQTTPPFIIYASQVTNTTTLAAEVVPDDTDIIVADSTGINVGDYTGLFNTTTNAFYVGTVLSINVNTLSMDTPVDMNFEIGDTVGTGITNMRVDGSTTTQVFTLRGADPGLSVTLDVTRIMILCVTATATELTDFGDIPLGLVKGLVMRRADGTINNIFNFKTNIEMKGAMFDWDALEASNPGQGVNGFAGRLTFAGQNKMGVVIRIGPGESVELLVQDDLTSLLRLNVIFEGSLAIV